MKSTTILSALSTKYTVANSVPNSYTRSAPPFCYSEFDGLYSLLILRMSHIAFSQ